MQPVVCQVLSRSTRKCAARAGLGRASRAGGLLLGAALLLQACAGASLFQPVPAPQEIGAAPGDSLASLPAAEEPAAPIIAPPVGTEPLETVVIEERVLPGKPTARKVGLLLPLSGPQARVGRDLLDAAQIALFDIAGADFELLPRDTGGTPEGAAAAAQAAIDDGAELLLGPLLSQSAAAVAPVAKAAGLQIVAFTNDLSIVGEGVFAMGFVPQAQARRVIAYARAEGFERFAALAPLNSYGVALTRVFEDAVAVNGGSVSDSVFYPTDEPDLENLIRGLASYDERRQALADQRATLRRRSDPVSRQALRRLSNRETLGDPAFDAVFLPDGPEVVLRIAPLLAFYDVDPARVKLLGTWLWDSPGLGTEPSMVGAWFAAPQPNGRASLVARFERTYGRPPDRRATLAYDAVALAAVLAQRASPQDDPYTPETLTTPSGFAGTDGIFRLTPGGEVERGLAVLEVTRDGAEVVDPAPTSFAAFVAEQQSALPAPAEEGSAQEPPAESVSSPNIPSAKAPPEPRRAAGAQSP